EELARTREELRGSLGESAASNEELRASNEELQSINEELRSTTEELETSKEELQSVNEELVTVNQELKLKVEEASLANDDLLNLSLLVESTKDFAIITVDANGIVTSWNEGARRLFGFDGPEIIGQPLDLLSTLQDRAAGAAQEEMRTAREEGRATDERWHVRKD